MSDQIQLLPDERAEEVGTFGIVSLNELPNDEELISPEPSPSFTASVRRFGVIAPVLLIEDADGVDRGTTTYKVADGRRRIKAARRGELDIVWARVFPATWSVADVLALVANEQRSHNPASDLRSIKNLLTGGASEDEICAAVGLPKGTLKKRMKLMNLRDELLEAYERGQIKTSVAEASARLNNTKQEELVRVLEENGKITSHDVRALTQASTRSAIESLPLEMFATPDAQSGEDTPPPPPPGTREWCESLRVLVAEALDLIPLNNDADSHEYKARAALRDAYGHAIAHRKAFAKEADAIAQNAAATTDKPAFMQEWERVKAQHPDTILLFRMGDFYECFGEDAQIVARECEITLTARSKAADAMPMAGVPVHAAERYIAQLVGKGYRCAICEQVDQAPRVLEPVATEAKEAA